MLSSTRAGNGAPRHHRIRIPRTWRVRVACLVGLLVVVAVAGDRIAARLAAGAVADRLACTAGLTSRPSVRFGDRPFLPQALTGRFTDVDVTAHDVRRQEVTVETVHARLREVSLPARDRVHAAHVSIELTVGYAALPAQIGGRHVSYRHARGMLAADTMLTVAGRQVPVTVLLEPTISDNTMTIRPREVDVLGLRGPVAASARDAAIGPEFSRTLPALPTGLRYRSLTATDNGLRLTIGGDDVIATADDTSCRDSR